MGLEGGMVKAAGSGMTRAEVRVDDSNAAAALIKQRMAAGLYDTKSPLVLE